VGAVFPLESTNPEISIIRRLDQPFRFAPFGRQFFPPRLTGAFSLFSRAEAGVAVNGWF
jgi:hypothetical protein